MKNRWVAILLGFSLIFGGLLAFGCAADTQAPELGQGIEDISAQDAYDLVQANLDNPDFIILDVRTPEEFASGHIVGAVNYNFYDADFGEQLNPLDKDKTYLLHCRSGARSGKTLDLMKEQGFTNIYHMSGGMIQWTALNLPLEQ